MAVQRRVRWGVLGAASIALRKVIPGMQGGEMCDIAAIASRSLQKAESAAQSLRIPQAYGSYEELLADRAYRSDLQSAAQSSARAVVDQGAPKPASTCCARSRSALTRRRSASS